MSLFASYAMCFVPSSFLGVMVISYIQMNYLHRMPEVWIPGLPLTLGVTVLFIGVILIAAYVITKPFEETFRGIMENGKKPEEKDRELLKKISKYLNTASVVGVLCGFVIGTIASNVIKMNNGVIPGGFSRIIMVALHSVGFGLLETSFMLVVTNHLMKKYREKLQIHVVEESDRSLSIGDTILLVAVAAVVFVTVNIMVIGYGYIASQLPSEISSYATACFLIGVVSMGLTVALIYFVTKGLSDRIRASTETIQMIEKGNLSSRINLVATDDFGVLNTAVNRLIKRLQMMFLEIRNDTEVVNNTASELAHVSDAVTSALETMNGSLSKIESEGKTQGVEISQAGQNVSGLMESLKSVEGQVLNNTSAMRESSSSISEMTANISSVADMTRKADSVSENLTDLCKNGRNSLVQATTTMSAIQDASIKVKEIVGVLQGIASQTNLLSMNAAIEAAHAGTAGQGFAVVAGEVRSLATSSADSSTQIQQYIQDMVEKIESGVASIELTTSSFKQIEAGVEQSAQLIRSITSAMEEQQRGAQDNLATTREAYEGTNRIKDLVVSQNSITRSVEHSMQSAVNAARNMENAVNDSASASEKMKEAVSRIDSMIKENKEAVQKMNSLLKSFSL